MGDTAQSMTLASSWLSQLSVPGSTLNNTLLAMYNSYSDLYNERKKVIQATIQRFQTRFGDQPVHVYRAPGRINLRGMHVDTHGGFLNLLTHQRETVVVVSPVPQKQVTAVHVEDEYPEISINLDDIPGKCDMTMPWSTWSKSFVKPNLSPGSWGAYVQGSILRACYEAARHNGPTTGLCLAVHGDIPRGASLSSSASLCVALLQAATGCWSIILSSEDMIIATQDAEWFTGARVGVSDQAAILLGEPDTIIHFAPKPSKEYISTYKKEPFPKDLALIIADSFTRRSLSGVQAVKYTQNRFAYSMAILLIQHEMMAMGVDARRVNHIDCFSKLSPECLDDIGGLHMLYDLLLKIPLQLTLDKLRSHYSLPNLDAQYERFFGALSPEIKPQNFQIRGPLLFGIAESERARLFPQYLCKKQYREAGQLMTTGHNGDRVCDHNGNPYLFDVSDIAIERYRNASIPIHHVAGSYRASSPALDALVDALHSAGALGASLTGAGIGGAVIALCKRDDISSVVEFTRYFLMSDVYAQRANLPSHLDAVQAEKGVCVNVSVCGAGMVPLPCDTG